MNSSGSTEPVHLLLSGYAGSRAVPGSEGRDMRKVSLAALVVAVVAGGCGTSDRPSSDNGAVISQAQKTGDRVSAFESALRSKLGATLDTAVQSTDIYNLPTGSCTVYVLSGTATVRIYKNAGDPVVTDPSGQLGAKVGCDSANEARGLSQVAAILQGF